MERKSLTQMKVGEVGKIVEIHGSAKMCLKLANLGIREGEIVKKLNQQIMRGPIVVEVGRSQIAIGFTLAGRVFVEIGG